MTHTYDKPTIARSVARMLLEIRAVLFRADDPFTLTSGMKSPVYIDCRKIIAFPRMRAQMMDYGRTVIMNDIGYESLDAVAGGETAGIPFAAWLAERTALPMHYVRKKPKGFGRDARIEGDIQDGQRVLLVEDLTTDGGSKLSFGRRHPRGRCRGWPYLRDLLLRHFQGYAGKAGRRGNPASLFVDLVGCAGGKPRGRQFRRGDADPG